MGKILPSYRKAVIDEISDNIFANASHYYAFAANPIEYPGTTPDVPNDDYSNLFTNDWQMLFGKKIKSSDIAPVIIKNIWTSNNVYDRYDNTSNTLHVDNNFYVISAPTITGASYHIYKCIDNANGAPSTINPGTIGTPTQPTSFQTGDDYKWRYICSITSANYEKFSSAGYVPVFANATIVSTAASYSGVEVVMISNGGVGYSTYTNGTVLSTQNTSLIQLSSEGSENNDHYVNNAIYIYNTYDTTSQLTNITNYVVNSSGKWVYVNPVVNTSTINSGVSKYLISPRVVFNTDGDSQPKAYSVINTTSNSIQSIIMLDNGTNISWANVYIQGNTSFGSGANLYAIVPPPGGHGSDPVTELNVKGMVFNFSFANTESNTIVTSNVVFNKIGIIKNPYSISANVETGTVTKDTRYSNNTFNQLLRANTGTSYAFTVGSAVIGNTSLARGTVVFSNTTQVFLTGDKHFIDGEYVYEGNTSGSTVTTITFNANTLGDIYVKDLKPIYVENINNVNRTDAQTESFKLTIEI